MLTEYNVLQQENIFDLVIKFYNDLDQTYSFIQNNPQLENINFDFENTSNVVVKYDPSYLLNTPSEIPSVASSTQSTTGIVKAYEVQNLFDVCLMTYGSFDLMYQLLSDNGIVSINETQIAQKYFTYNTSLVDDNILLDHIQKNNIVFATGYDNTIILTTYYILTENSFILDTESGDKLTIE